jgi:hypothetical protein
MAPASELTPLPVAAYLLIAVVGSLTRIGQFGEVEPLLAAVEGELVEEGLAAHGDEGEDLLLSLARPWAMPERETADLTEFVDLPLFGSAAAAAPSGNGANPEPSPAEDEAATPEPSAVTPAGRDGDYAEETTPAQGEQLRLLL